MTCPLTVELVAHTSVTFFQDTITILPCLSGRVVPRKTIQNTPSQQHPVFSNTGKLWGGFHFLFLYNLFYNTFFFQLKNSFSFSSQSRSIFFLCFHLQKCHTPKFEFVAETWCCCMDIWFMVPRQTDGRVKPYRTPPPSNIQSSATQLKVQILLLPCRVILGPDGISNALESRGY